MTNTTGESMDESKKTSKKVLTLALIDNSETNEILLGLKKRGFGEGLWNGFGGKVDVGEEILDAAVREVKEECGLTVIPSDMEKFAVINFEFVGDPVILEVHLFRCSKFSGVVTESDEMLPKWFPRENVPHAKMWPDDKVWYPLYLNGSKFQAYFLFEGYNTILSYEIRDFDNPSEILKEMKLNRQDLDLH